MMHTPNAASYAMCIYNNDLYIGGWFQYQIHRPGMTFSKMTGIAKWNGTTFDTLLTGLDQGGAIADFAVYNSELVAAGVFTIAGGVPVNKITRWNSVKFDSLGSGINGISVKALAVYGGQLYAAGIFTLAGNVPVKNIARWNGVAWDSVGGGTDNQIWDLQVYNGELYATGYFTKAGSVSANSMAKWNGLNWSAVSGGINGIGVTMKVYQNELYVAGNFSQANSINTGKVAKWDGINWSALSGGVSVVGTVNHLEVYNNKLIMGGNFSSVNTLTVYNVASYDGLSWATLGTGTELCCTGPNINVTFPFGGTLFVAGTFTQLMSDTSYYIAQYNMPLNVDEFEKSKFAFKIIPNPNNGEFNLRFLEGRLPDTIQISDILGREIFVDDSPEILVKLHDIGQGIYLVKAVYKDRIESQKLIIQN